MKFRFCLDYKFRLFKFNEMTFTTTFHRVKSRIDCNFSLAYIPRIVNFCSRFTSSDPYFFDWEKKKKKKGIKLIISIHFLFLHFSIFRGQDSLLQNGRGFSSYFSTTMQVLREERVRVDEEDRRIQGEELFSFAQPDAKGRGGVAH